MAQDEILNVILKNRGINGNELKEKLDTKWGVTQQVNRLRQKGLVEKIKGDNRLTWKYYPTKLAEELYGNPTT